MLGCVRFVSFAVTMAVVAGCDRSHSGEGDSTPHPATWDDVDESDGDAKPVWSADGGFVAIAGVVLRTSDGAREMSFEGVPIAFNANGSALAVAPTPSQAEAEGKIDSAQPLRARTGFSIVTAAGVRFTKPELRFRGWAPKGSAYLASERAQTYLALDGTDRLVPLKHVGTSAGSPAFDATGALVVYSTRDPLKLVAVDVASGNDRATFTLPHDATSFGWLGDRVWACGEQDGMVFFAPLGDPSNTVAIDITAPRRPGTVQPASSNADGGISSCEAPAHASTLVVTEGSNRATLVDPKDGALIVRVDAKKRFSHLSFSATGSHAALTFPEEGVALVDIAQKSVRRLPGREARFHPEKPLLLLETESSIEVRDATRGAVVASLRGSLKPWGGEESFSGGALLGTAHDASLTIWDLDRAAPRISVPIERASSSSGKPDSPSSWTWGAPSVGPAYASFVRQRAYSADAAKATQIQEAVLVRIADGARLIIHAVPDGPRFRFFAHTEHGEFDAYDADLEQVFLRSGTDHTPASKLTNLRHPGLVQAFFRGEYLPP